MYRIIFLIALFTAKAITGETNKCIPRDFGYGSVVCVCNSTYCDNPPETEPPAGATFHQIVSSKDGLRMDFSTGQFENSPTYNITIEVNSNNTYQTIIGWGCAFTDSNGINMRKLSEQTQERIMRQYFGDEGSRYSLCRVPIGGTDFSVRPYTLDDSPDDVNLTNFSLQPEDVEYKIPYIKKALNLNSELKFVASPWSAPGWMKTKDKVNGGSLLPKYYSLYAEYLLKFCEGYKKHGIKTWGLTTGNEPINGVNPFVKINSMAWDPNELGKWIADCLGPTIEQSICSDVNIITLDDQRFMVPWYLKLLFRNKTVSQYVSGIATHWYADQFFPASLLSDTHALYPNKFLLMTEACTGSQPTDWPKVILGSWERAEYYITDIIDQMRNYVSGWIDWNCVLDKEGGPNWIKNFVDSPIIVIPESDEFYKQPMFYAMAHVSRYVPRGATVIATTQTDEILTTAFLLPNKEIVTILYNRAPISRNISIHDKTTDRYINLNLTAQSIYTITYSRSY